MTSVSLPLLPAYKSLYPIEPLQFAPRRSAGGPVRRDSRRELALRRESASLSRRESLSRKESLGRHRRSGSVRKCIRPLPPIPQGVLLPFYPFFIRPLPSLPSRPQVVAEAPQPKSQAVAEKSQAAAEMRQRTLETPHRTAENPPPLPTKPWILRSIVPPVPEKPISLRPAPPPTSILKPSAPVASSSRLPTASSSRLPISLSNRFPAPSSNRFPASSSRLPESRLMLETTSAALALHHQMLSDPCASPEPSPLEEAGPQLYSMPGHSPRGSRQLEYRQAVKKLRQLEDEDDWKKEHEEDYTWIHYGGMTFRALPIRRYSKKWIWERGSQRWEELDYASVNRALRNL
ncbi:hypothetical protein C8J56DRAFT_168428 [Mycena floridula]|nr:hypothetical protein C8J56DRAFT_168428 [Mycena floridula]